MKRLEPRIEKLEARAPKAIPRLRSVVIGVPPCDEKHIVGATVGEAGNETFLKRIPGESLDALQDRAAATVTEVDRWIIVRLKSPCYDSGGSKCRDIGGIECRGRKSAAIGTV